MLLVAGPPLAGALVVDDRERHGQQEVADLRRDHRRARPFIGLISPTTSAKPRQPAAGDALVAQLAEAPPRVAPPTGTASSSRASHSAPAPEVWLSERRLVGAQLAHLS